MLKISSRRAALVLAGTTLALAAGVLPAQAATSASKGWRTEATIAVKGKQVLLSGIDAISAGNAWVAGDAATSKGTKAAGLLEHWSGKGWKAVTLPSAIQKDWTKDTANSFPVIGASSSTDVWAFADLAVTNNYIGYVRLNGHKWTAGKLPGTSISSGDDVLVTGTKVISSSNVWVFGGKVDETSTSSTLSLVPYAAHYNGKSWKTVSVPGSGAITAASEISATNIWAVLGVPWLLTGGAAAVSPAVVQWNGTKWAATAVQPSSLPAGANLTSILANRGNKVWIGGGATNSKGGTSEFTAKLTGSSWTEGNLSAPASSADFSVWDLVSDGSGGVWGLAESNELAKPRFWHLTSSGTTWTSASTSFGGSNRVIFQLAPVPHSTSVWGAGAIQRSGAVDGLAAIYGATPK
jgi:hypothetical protein